MWCDSTTDSIVWMGEDERRIDLTAILICLELMHGNSTLESKTD